jgi:hypothetical protein
MDSHFIMLLYLRLPRLEAFAKFYRLATGLAVWAIDHFGKFSVSVAQAKKPISHQVEHDRLGRGGFYSFAVPEAVTRGELRPLRNPNDA